MASHNYRMSQYSMNSASVAHQRSNTLPNVSSQVSTTTLLNSLHGAFTASQPYPLESSASLVVNTWVTGSSTGPDGRYGGTVDAELARRAWEHARRRAEDGCIVLGSLHRSAPSLFAPFVSALPLAVPGAFYVALNALRPFVHCVTPCNPSLPRYSALAGTFTLALTGEITGASLSLSTSGIDTRLGLLNVPSEPGHRAFDVFYYLLAGSHSEQEREFLGIKSPDQYAFLRRSETYRAPPYLPTADDAAAAEDFRDSLKDIGIRGKTFRNLLSVVAAVLRLGDGVGFLVDEDELEAVCEEVGLLLELDPSVLMKKCATEEREILIAAIYEALVDWVIMHANEAVRKEIRSGTSVGSATDSDDGEPTPPSSHDDGDSVSITVVEIPGLALAKAASLKTVFDDTAGINAEMKEDGVTVVPAGSSVIREMNEAVSQNEADMDLSANSSLAREREQALDRREAVLEKVGAEADEDTFLRRILYPVDGQGIALGKTGRINLMSVLGSSRVWFHLCLHPSDDAPASLANQAATYFPWSAGAVSSQIRAWRLPEWANYRNKQLDFTADFDVDEFVDRYRRLGCMDGRDGVEAWIVERGWSNGEVFVGHERIWAREAAWWEAEAMLDMKSNEPRPGSDMLGPLMGAPGMNSTYSLQPPGMGNGIYGEESKEDLLMHQRGSRVGVLSPAPTQAFTARTVSGGDYGLGHKGDDKRNDITYYSEIDPELADGKEVIVQKVTSGRRAWAAFVWALTFWIPSPLLKYVGRMRRPDVRMAWREKVVLVFLILLANGFMMFWIIEFGHLLCPTYDKAWSVSEVSGHNSGNDYWVAFRGGVYDLSHFWKLQHSDTTTQTTQTNMQPLGGIDMTEYIMPPLTVACPGFNIATSVYLQPNNTLTYPDAQHVQGTLQPDQSSKLAQLSWYKDIFEPAMDGYYKGQLVYKKSDVTSQGSNDNRMWFIINSKIYDLTDYFYTLNLENNLASYSWLPSDLTNLVQQNPGADLTSQWNSQLNETTRDNGLNCMNNAFFIGYTDFRDSARCQVNNYILLAFTILLCVVILVKFLAALQFGSKRKPAQQDKFVICQVPAYTEGEDSLRKGLDSLTALAYDNKRKLICVMCDGMIVGGGNDRPTPKIVLDVLGVDPKIDPPALPFKSVGVGSEQLNYGKVYSGLYEFEGNVVPYLVIVKVGKESEQTKAKPGNRGKRDSQVMLMSFLNRVHHRTPMNPLELEIFHQINNIIGVDPELYEYLFMVDADTKVREDSLNRLVAACANDAKVVGICGETSLENAERSWWTMIQVYEYYISHHLSKAFESLFGSVTCLPGCFCMYRLRTADKGRPLIISDNVVAAYADNNFDTLHKKNLLSLGEDRYLTTLMLRNFPSMTFKFVPDAQAQTEAPASWAVLLSQRRRWINSTIHNLSEMIWQEHCGFFCFSMRTAVIFDLVGTIILPATCGYLIYLIWSCATHQGAFPLLSIIILCCVYGLQALIFILKRQWQHIGWMIIYLLAYPVWSVILPLYSFWKQDDFSWGNTRVVIEEKGSKQVVAIDDEGFDPRSIPLQRWDDYALANNLPGRRGGFEEKEVLFHDGGYEMDEMQSVYSAAQPASTILTGFPNMASQNAQQTFHQRPTASPNPYQAMQHPRHSTYSQLSRYTDQPQHIGRATPDQQTRLMSMGGMNDSLALQQQQQHHRRQSSLTVATARHPSRDNLLGGGSRSQTPLAHSPGPGLSYSRPQSTIPGASPFHHSNNSSLSLAGFQTQGPTHEAITFAIRECLSEVDLDTVTKKQLKALAEAKLQTQLTGEKKGFLDAQIDRELASM